MLKKFITLLISLGVIPDDKRTAAEAAAAQLDADDPAPNPAQPNDQTGNADVQQLRRDLAASQLQIKQLTDALSAETRARNEGAEAAKAQQTAMRKADIKKFLDDNVKRFAAEERTWWEEQLEKDFDGYKAALLKLNESPAVDPKDDKGKDGKGAKNEINGITGKDRVTSPLPVYNREELMSSAAAAFGDN